jgi:hypothetical protein
MMFVNRDELVDLFDQMTPNHAQKARMRENILTHRWKENAGKKKALIRRKAWLAISAAGLILVLFYGLGNPFGGHSTAYAVNIIGKDQTIINLADMQADKYGASVSYVDSRPDLEFYIDGENIAEIEITTKNEYIYAVDWTKTQHEKYWNVESFQHFDEERQISIADYSKLYDKKLTMTFDENFHDYDQIWYRWTAWNLYKWAAADNFAHFLGYGIDPKPQSEPQSEQEKMDLAAGQDNSGIGHIQLDGYPEELTEDTITITITDRQGKRTTKVINVKISNNEFRQTVVTARLTD